MTGKACAKKHKQHNKRMKLDVPITNSGTQNKFLKRGKNNPFTGDFF